MRIGSLFSGYGGLDLAVGGDLAWYSEIEPSACKVMEAHHPGVPNIGDVTKVDWSQVQPVDVITGGYPCQPFSNAGMRKGTNDERHLWPYVRDALSAIRPRYAVLENVRGHLTLGFDVVLADLADLGWSARWGVVRAADAGAPHNRARLFIVAYPGELAGQSTVTCRHSSIRVEAHRGVSRTDERVGQPYAHANSASGEAHDDGRQGRGNARRPQLVERGGPAATKANQQRLQHASIGVDDGSRQAAVEGYQIPAADASSGRRLWSERQLEQSAGAQDESLRGSAAFSSTKLTWGEYAPAIDRWQSVIGRPAPAPTIHRRDRDRLNPEFVEWMMGLPEGWVTGHGLSASQELKMLGNGVVPQQAALALQLLGGVK